MTANHQRTVLANRRTRRICHEAARIIFLRKVRGMTSISGEKVRVNRVINAIQDASRATGAAPEHFRAELDVDHSHLVLQVEFASRRMNPCSSTATSNTRPSPNWPALLN